MSAKKKLSRSAPEAQGVSSSAVLAFLDAVEKIPEMHSMMLVRHGQVVAEGWWSPYAAAHPHMLFSLSKSFTSTAAGLAIHEGKFSLDDSVVAFFPEDAPAQKSANLQAMKVRHLLSMSSGHDTDTLGSLFSREDGNWAKGFLGQAATHAPGTHFVYNSGATYMVSAIVQKTTGERVLDYLRPRLFEPLGIDHPTWEQCPRGINTGGWGLSVRTEDIAKFGQLYLQKGLWQGKRLLPENWVADATQAHIANGDPAQPSDWSQGYGFQFWRCRHGAYRGDGAFGQYCVVFPEKDAVLAITSGVGDMQAVLNAVWEKLLPGLGEGKMPPNSAENRRVQERLGALQLSVPAGEAVAAQGSPNSGKTFRFAKNADGAESATFVFTENGGTLTLRDGAGAHTIAWAGDAWRRGTTTLSAGGIGGAPGTPARPIAARGAWSDERTLTIKVCYVETPFIATLICRFDGKGVQFQRRMNVGFGPTEGPALEGILA